MQTKELACLSEACCIRGWTETDWPHTPGFWMNLKIKELWENRFVRVMKTEARLGGRDDDKESGQ
jgi:hypothetical protein